MEDNEILVIDCESAAEIEQEARFLSEALFDNIPSPKRDRSLSWRVQLQAGILPLKGHYLLMTVNDLTREIGSQFEAQSIINSIPGGIITGEIRGG